jgi:hypothetical protein
LFKGGDEKPDMVNDYRDQPQYAKAAPIACII